MALSSEALQIEAKIAAAFEASEQRCRRQEAERAAIVNASHRRALQRADERTAALEASLREANARAERERCARDASELHWTSSLALLRREMQDEMQQREAAAVYRGHGLTPAQLEALARPLVEAAEARVESAATARHELQQAEAAAAARAELDRKLSAVHQQFEAEASQLLEAARARIHMAERGHREEAARAAELAGALALAQPALRTASAELRRLRGEEARTVASEAEAIERRVQAAMGAAQSKLLHAHAAGAATAEELGRQEMARVMANLDEEQQPQQLPSQPPSHEPPSQPPSRVDGAELDRLLADARDRGRAEAERASQERTRAAVASALEEAAKRSEAAMSKVVAATVEQYAARTHARTHQHAGWTAHAFPTFRNRDSHECSTLITVVARLSLSTRRLHAGAPEAVKLLVDARCEPLRRDLEEARQQCQRLRQRVDEVTKSGAAAGGGSSGPTSSSSSSSSSSSWLSWLS